ncbi:MAG: cytochrome c [Bryobacteraceae bacterium]|nr:cytochrome c [Bryobacteraceae bacterium]
MRYTAALLIASSVVLLTGCGAGGGTSRQPPIYVFPDMRFQGKYKPQGERPFFADRRASRLPVAGTVALGNLSSDEGYHTGLVSSMYVGKNPEPMNEQLLVTGQRRFNTYCSPCHDRTGGGNGVVGKRSIWIASNLLEDRIKQYNDGELYYVITNGRRTMPGYKNQIAEKDRWAIVSYVRALQRATMGTMEEIPADLRSSMK